MSRPVVALLALLLAAPAASARNPDAKHTPHSAHHHNGLFMRLAAGIGFARAGQSSSGSELVLSGAGGSASLAFGGIIAPNLALNVDLFGVSAVGPKVELDGVDQGDANNTTMSLAAVGVGVTYYFMPINLYVAASVGPAVGRLETRISDMVFRDDSDIGLGVNAMVGKEWWVGREWAIGLAGQLVFATLPGDNADINVLGGGVLFSATWN